MRITKKRTIALLLLLTITMVLVYEALPYSVHNYDSQEGTLVISESFTDITVITLNISNEMVQPQYPVIRSEVTDIEVDYILIFSNKTLDIRSFSIPGIFLHQEAFSNISLLEWLDPNEFIIINVENTTPCHIDIQIPYRMMVYFQRPEKFSFIDFLMTHITQNFLATVFLVTVSLSVLLLILSRRIMYN